ncbi:MAG: peptidase, partial [Moraxellaceae bacterium]|nr:peptidase [Moraxellaceae bacterium]
YATVPLDHPDAAPLMLLGGFLRNGFLHGAIRERGGAYGGGAGYDSNACAFRFYSYRDPRLEGTLADFDASVRWLLEEKHEQRQLEEAVLGIISDMDKPLSPAGEARVAYHNALYGRTPEQRRRTRARILSTTLDDLRRVGELYLTQDAVTAVVLPAAKAGAAEALGLRLEKL